MKQNNDTNLKKDASKNYGMEKRGGNDKPAPLTQKPMHRPPSQIKEKK